jgi:hypothetical protein
LILAITGAIGGYGGKLNSYGEGIRSKFAADGYVGASASQKAKKEPSEATKPYGLKRLPDASAPGAYVTNVSRKVLPKSMQPTPSAAATKQVRSQSAKPLGAPRTGQKALPAPTPKNNAKALPASVTRTPARTSSAPPTKKPVMGATGAPTKKPIPAAYGPAAAAAKTPAPARGIANTPKPATAGINTNKPPAAANGKVKISAASKPKPAVKKPVLN